MLVLDYNLSNHQEVITLATYALKNGAVVAFPTDTSYGLAVLAANNEFLQRLYVIKGRDFNKPVHIIPSSNYDITDIVSFNVTARKLVKHFWPGALTLVLPILEKSESNVKKDNAWKAIKHLSANSGWLGFRKPANTIAVDLAKTIAGSITATSANVSGQPDCYTAEDIVGQYKNRKHKPDIIINAGRLPKHKPSTLVKVDDDGTYEIIRRGPISETQIKKVLHTK